MSPSKFSVISRSRPDSVGGGVVAEGGGGSGRICSGSCRSKSIKLPQFRQIFLHFRFKDRNNINSLGKKNIYQKFWGGGMAPVATPGYATASYIRTRSLVTQTEIHSNIV